MLIGISFLTLPTKLSLMTLVGGDEAQNTDGRLGTGWVDTARGWLHVR